MALLRVRTGHEYPEGNRRELLGDSKLNCGIAKEREKINWPEHTAGRSQNKGSSPEGGSSQLAVTEAWKETGLCWF